MVDHFGRSIQGINRGALPVPGPPGVSGFGAFVNHLPKSTLSVMRIYDLDCTFLLSSKETDITVGPGNRTSWISRSQTNPARFQVEQDGKQLELHELNYKKRWSLILDGESLLKCQTLSFARHVSKSYGFFCITFQNKSNNEQVLLSTLQEKRSDVTELRCTETEIFFQCGHVTETIQYTCLSKWVTLYMGYTAGTFITNWTYKICTDDEEPVTGEFKTGTRADYQATTGMTIGGRWEGEDDPAVTKKYFTGEIANFESLDRFYKETGNSTKNISFPAQLRDVIIYDQIVYEDLRGCDTLAMTA